MEIINMIYSYVIEKKLYDAEKCRHSHDNFNGIVEATNSENALYLSLHEHNLLCGIMEEEVAFNVTTSDQGVEFFLKYHDSDFDEEITASIGEGQGEPTLREDESKMSQICDILEERKKQEADKIWARSLRTAVKKERLDWL